MSLQITMLILVVAALVALLFVRDKRVKGGVAGAGLLALLGVYLLGNRKAKQLPKTKPLEPDTLDKEREKTREELSKIDIEVEDAGLSVVARNPVAVHGIRARLAAYRKRRRDNLHDDGGS